MLTVEEKRWLLDLARGAVSSRLEGRPAPAAVPESSRLRESSGAFVTLHRHGALRGCIGLVQAVKPLYQAVQEMAVSAAFEDPRFPPLRPEELDDVEVEISVMSPLKRVRSAGEIRVGEHGLLMKRGFHQGLLLPQVATEQGWDRDTFLRHTCFKAGMSGDCWKDPATEIYV
ncbi:MAG: AmmeMemoRadiSam system protein A, partial [Spirochaetota bacterium]